MDPGYSATLFEARCVVDPKPQQRAFFIDNLLVRIHFIIVMIRWTGLAPWEFEFPFPGSLTSTFLETLTPSPATTAALGTLSLPRDPRQPPEPLAARRLRNHTRSPRARLGIRRTAGYDPPLNFFFFFTLVTGPRRSLSLKLSDIRVYEPQIRAPSKPSTCAVCCQKRNVCEFVFAGTPPESTVTYKLTEVPLLL